MERYRPPETLSLSLEPMFYIGWLALKPKTFVKKIADMLGGADLADYKAPLGDLSCNKGSHKERSIKNQPNHESFWKKISKKKKSKP